MKKKFLMVLLTVMAAFAVFTINASAATDSGNCGPSDSPASVTWTMDTDSGTLTITGSGQMGNYSEATQPWTAYLGSIQSVVVEDGVTNIGDYAFNDCTALTSITLPDSIIRIGNQALGNCSNLLSLSLPKSLTFLGNYPFDGCSSLKSLFIPAFSSNKLDPNTIASAVGGYCPSLESIVVDEANTRMKSQDGVLYYKINEELTSLMLVPARKTGTLSIPEGVMSISDLALSYCKLTQIEIPSTVDIIDPFWQLGNETLQTITVAAENPNYSSVDGLLLTKDKKTLVSVPGGRTTCTIPDGVTTIQKSAFEEPKVTAVTIPASVTTIQDYAFQKCDLLNTVYYTGSSQQWAAIDIGTGNNNLWGIPIHFNYGALILSAAWDAEHYNPGDTATATVNLYGGADTAYAGYQFTIDSIAGMTLTSIEPIVHEGVSGYADANPQTGKVVFSLNGASDLSLDETGYDIATLTYKVNKGADGARTLSFSETSAYLADSTPVERFKTTSASLTLHDIKVTLSGDADGHATTIRPATTYYAKYDKAGLYTNWERTQAVTAEDFQCNVDAGYELASPMWAENGTQNTVANFAALLEQTYTESKSYTLRVGVVYALSLDDTGIVSVVSGAELKEDGKYYIVKNTDLVLAPVTESGSILLGVSASIGDQPVTVTRGEGGNYTIAGNDLTGNITLTCDAITGTIGFVTMENYVNDTGTASQLLRVTVENPLTGDHLTLGGQDLFWSEKYKAYVGFVASTMNETGVRASIARAAGEGTSIGYTGDVTGDSTVNVLDALAINARLFQISWKPGYTDKGLLEMDVTGDVAVNVADIQRILAIAVGKATA